MAQSSARKKASLAIESSLSYPILDVVDVKVEYGASRPGFILVPGGFHPTSPGSLIGKIAVVEAEDSSGEDNLISITIINVRDHGPTISLLVEDWPINTPPPRAGWTIRVPDADLATHEHPKQT